MCGIFFSVGVNGPIYPDEDLVRLLELRGPDSYQAHQLKIPLCEGDEDLGSTSTGHVDTTFVSSVLSLRGDHVSVQPFVDPASDSVLCWNGEAWRYDESDVVGNDANFIFEHLVGISGAHDNSNRNHPGEPSRIQMLLDCLSSISGPYSFVFYDGPTRSILCGRDCLGRRSLLSKRDSRGEFMIASVCGDETRAGWEEIEANGIHAIKIGRDKNEPYDLSLIPWTRSGITRTGIWHLQSRLPCFNQETPNGPLPALTLTSRAVSELETLLMLALKLRLQGIPNLRSRDDTKFEEKSSKVAILFSGGVDCTVLARLAHEILPPDEMIDLLNVVFENPRVVAFSTITKSQESLYEECPDRMTARSSLAELCHVCPGRTWRLVSINVPYSEATGHRRQIVSLMHPHNTEMDLSIAYALYFAARGQGKYQDPMSGRPLSYTTSARVLLSGLGADELFGGYRRHATAFARHGFSGLLDELEIDVSRLGKRNLGRDDRVISHWGREVRYPYLDESLLSWALEAPVWEKCGFGLPQPDDGISPDLEAGKQALRLLAWKLGMKMAAKEKKRAIQFGARTAKMERGKKKGTELLS